MVNGIESSFQQSTEGRRSISGVGRLLAESAKHAGVVDRVEGLLSQSMLRVVAVT